jgi:hypothetical protein
VQHLGTVVPLSTVCPCALLGGGHAVKLAEAIPPEGLGVRQRLEQGVYWRRCVLLVFGGCISRGEVAQLYLCYAPPSSNASTLRFLRTLRGNAME